jgi:hypothetical protein
MTYARIPDFSQPVPVRSPAERRAARAVAIGLPPEALEPAQPTTAMRAAAFVGELLTAAIIIAGGVFAYGFMPLG